MTLFEGDLAFLNEVPPINDEKPSAHWLNDYVADTWVMTAGDIRKSINWSVTLPDGTNLLDSENSIILETCRRTLFESKSSYITNKYLSVDRVKFYSQQIFSIVDWVIVNSQEYQPRKYAFSRLDSDGIKAIIKTFVQDGVDGVRYIVKRLEKAFDEILQNPVEMLKVELSIHSVPPALLTTTQFSTKGKRYSSKEIAKLKSWLYLNGYYFGSKGKLFKSLTGEMAFYLNRSVIPKLIGVGNTCGLSPSTAVFLKQFEVVTDYEKLELVTTYSTREFLPSDYKSSEEAADTLATLGVAQNFINTLNLFAKLTPFIAGLPDYCILSSLNLLSIAKSFGAGGDKHHRTTPVEIALNLMGSSIEYIIKYGDAVVDLAIAWLNGAVEQKKKYKALGHGGMWTHRASRNAAFSVLHIPDSLSALNITRIYSAWGNQHANRNQYGGHTGGAFCRSDMSIEDALIFLFASSYILIASLSARRSSEICELRHGCVIGGSGSHDLAFDLCKVEVEGRRAKIKRPIPNIVAKAIRLLERFGRSYQEICGSAKNKYVFSFPLSLTTYLAEKPKSDVIDAFVCKFCDYIDLEKTAPNKRWYPKTHEFRRFFAIVFFWQFKYANISAISWMLGHVNTEHTYAYIREVVGGSELTTEEARYSAEAMLGDDEIDALNTLRQLAMKHFHCTNISAVERDELEMYLEELLEEGVYEVRPYSFETEDGVSHKMVFEILKKGGGIDDC